MENFVVSALKYRPQTFDTVVGQSPITTTLKNAIRNNQLAHAFLFCGPRGVGKTTCARILAKTINCENRTEEGEACNQCASCQSFNHGQSFNIHELDAASNNSVEDIRTLTEQVRFAPQAGKYKVYIIDEVHMLSASAFNAFLKTLEEPPSYAVFILATTEKHKILPTILSRCQIFDFRRITIQDTVDHLQEICDKEAIKADPDALHLIAQKTEGCMRDSLSTLDKIISFTNGDLTYKNTLEHLNILDYDFYFRALDALERQDAGAGLLLFDEILHKGFEGDDFLDGLAGFIRDLLVAQDPQVVHLLEVPDNMKPRYEKAAKGCDAAFLVSALSLLNEAGIQYKTARNKRLVVEMCLIRLSYLQQAVQLIADERTGAVSKKKLTDPLTKPQPLRPPLPRATLRIEEEVPVKAKPEITESLASAVSASGERLAPTPLTPQVATAATPGSSVPSKETARPARSSGKTDIFQTSGKLDLGNIRQKLEVREHAEAAQASEEVPPFSIQTVDTLWKAHIEALKAASQLQIATHLEMAVLSAGGPLEVVITCRSPLHKTFVDDEKLLFAEKLKEHFHNPAIQVLVQVDESLQKRDRGPKVLTQRQQLEEMLKQYPLIQELKQNLKLDLG
jgi:DNA polymerase-3 subunit gamma/tau